MAVGRHGSASLRRALAAAAALHLAAGCATARPGGGAEPTTRTSTSTPPAAPPAPPPSATELFSDGVRLARDAGSDPAALLRAADAFDQAFAADPGLPYAAVNAGILRERLGDDDGAAAAYGRALDRSPAFAPAARGLVRLRIRRGDAAGAEQEARARLARAPDAPALHDALAEALLAAGRLDDAEQEARRALKLDERNAPAMTTLATVYQRRKRHELARMVLENARQVDDRDPAVWNRLGFADLALGNRAQALEDFRTAAALGPDYAEARANYGAFLADAEDWAGATAELEAAVRLAPRSAPAWLLAGNAWRGAQQFEKAESAYRKARELDPALRDVDFNLAVLYLDGDRPGTPALARLEQGVAFLDAFEREGGTDPRVAEYRKDAGRAIERERKRLAREERDRLRREAEARKKEEATGKESAAAAAPAASPSPDPTPDPTPTPTPTPTPAPTTTSTPSDDATARKERKDR